MANQPNRLEIFLNEIRSDVDVLSAILQGFVGRLIAMDSDPHSRLDELKESAKAVIARSEIEGDPQLVERKIQMMQIRADRFFQEIDTALGQAESMLNKRDAN